jgi:hypothetical protein
VRCSWPAPHYKDFNDQLRGRPMAAAATGNNGGA